MIYRNIFNYCHIFWWGGNYYLHPQRHFYRIPSDALHFSKSAVYWTIFCSGFDCRYSV